VPNLLYVIEVVVAFGMVIFVHELGHFLAAKWCGVHVRKFAIGFGPPLVKWQPGETEYSIRPIPLGGYVDLAGEQPGEGEDDDPRGLFRRPAWQRVVVFSAGVAMNAVLAIVLFTVASLVGVQALAPVIGDVEPLLPAALAGIEPGDRILSMNGRPVTSFEDIQSIVVGCNAGSPFDLVIERVDEAGRPQRLTFDDVLSYRGPDDSYPVLGIAPAAEPVIAQMLPGSPEEQAGLKPGDHILTVNGKPIVRWRQINVLLAEADAGPVTLTIRRDGEQHTIVARPSDLEQTDLGLTPPVTVGTVDPAGPAAKTGLRSGDRLVRVNDVAWPTIEQLQETIRAGGDGGMVEVVVHRDGEEETFAIAAAVYGDVDHPRIGISMTTATDAPVRVGHVAADGPAAEAGLRPGDELRSLNAGEDKVTPRTWKDVLAVFGKAGADPVAVEVLRGEKTVTATVTARRQPVEQFILASSAPEPLLYEALPRVYNPLKAAGQGFRRTWTWLKRVYNNFLQTIKGEVGRESFGGPVLIATASYTIASRGLGTFVDFWGILSVCIAVINFLPLPPFDGGHVVFVLIESLKGSPVSLKVRNAVWGAGWLAVLALFILITWQDIARLVM